MCLLVTPSWGLLELLILLFIAGHSGPCHWSRKTWDSGVHLMGRKNRLVVIILDYTLESTLIVFLCVFVWFCFFFFLSSVGQATCYTKSASIFGGRKEKNKQTNKKKTCFLNLSSLQWATSKRGYIICFASKTQNHPEKEKKFSFWLSKDCYSSTSLRVIARA